MVRGAAAWATFASDSRHLLSRNPLDDRKVEIPRCKLRPARDGWHVVSSLSFAPHKRLVTDGSGTRKQPRRSPASARVGKRDLARLGREVKVKRFIAQHS